MIKRLVRKTFRSVRSWLDDGPRTPTETQSHLSAVDALCVKVLEKGCDRPNYVWGIVNAASLARTLGIPRISVVELGVAGGNGLTAMERIATDVGDELGVSIDVYGFDSGAGLPKPTDYRDLPNLFSEGSFAMDKEKLLQRLKKAKLFLGLVDKTIPEFLDSNPAPLGFIAFDLDLYSSTAHALKLLSTRHELLLPRIYCYFDDIAGFTYSEFSGELLAISEFNESHAMRKVSKITCLGYSIPKVCRPGCWVEQFYMAHIFDHQLYARYDGTNPRTSLDLIASVLSPVVFTRALLIGDLPLF